jgi:hypothetical protein
MSDPHKGFFKVEEEALRHLKRTFDEPSSYRKASAAYIALLRISNLKKSAVFEERIAAIADDMGYNYNDAAKALQLVKLAKLCEIEARTIPGSKERDKSVYTVKRMLPEKEGTLPEKEGRLHESQNSQLLQRVPKKSPSSPEEHPQEARLKKTSTSSKDDVTHESLKASGCSEERIQFLEKFNDYARSHSHALLPITAYTPELDKALEAHEDDGFEDLCTIIEQEVREFDGPPDKRLTLVRLVWGNY